MNNNEYLIEWSKLEDQKLKQNVQKFNQEVLWVTEIFLLIQRFEKLLKNPKCQFQTSVGLMHMAVKDVHLAFLSIFRGHFSLAFKNIRSAIEATTFINAIRGDVKKANIWLGKKLCDQEDGDYKKLLQEGRNGKNGKQLGNRFKLASEKSHANLFKLFDGRESEILLSEKVIVDKYSYFDEDEDWFVAYSHYLISTTFLLLEVFEDAFRSEIQNSDFAQILEKKLSEYKSYSNINKDHILLTDKLSEDNGIY